MLRFVATRIALAVFALAAVTAILVTLLNFVPGDPSAVALGPRATPEMRAAFAAERGLDRPIYEQYCRFIGGVLLAGSLGTDLFSNRPVLDIVAETLPYTALLAVVSLAWAAVLGIPLGCLAALRPGSLLDRVTALFSIGAIAIPAFVVALYALLVFAVGLRWLPATCAGTSGTLLDKLHCVILPALAVGLGWVGYIARLVRAALLDALGEPHVTTALAFGLPASTRTAYALRVAILPVITVLGAGLGGLLSGAVFAEVIFGWPGIGRVLVDAVLNRNYPVVMGGVLATTALYLATTLAADIVTVALDPRVREAL